jgi:hypothetical protein
MPLEWLNAQILPFHRREQTFKISSPSLHTDLYTIMNGKCKNLRKKWYLFILWSWFLQASRGTALILYGVKSIVKLSYWMHIMNLPCFCIRISLLVVQQVSGLKWLNLEWNSLHQMIYCWLIYFDYIDIHWVNYGQFYIQSRASSLCILSRLEVNKRLTAGVMLT